MALPMAGLYLVALLLPLVDARRLIDADGVEHRRHAAPAGLAGARLQPHHLRPAGGDTPPAAGAQPAQLSTAPDGTRPAGHGAGTGRHATSWSVALLELIQRHRKASFEMDRPELMVLVLCVALALGSLVLCYYLSSRSGPPEATASDSCEDFSSSDENTFRTYGREATQKASKKRTGERKFRGVDSAKAGGNAGGSPPKEGAGAKRAEPDTGGSPPGEGAGAQKSEKRVARISEGAGEADQCVAQASSERDGFGAGPLMFTGRAPGDAATD